MDRGREQKSSLYKDNVILISQSPVSYFKEMTHMLNLFANLYYYELNLSKTLLMPIKATHELQSLFSRFNFT